MLLHLRAHSHSVPVPPTLHYRYMSTADKNRLGNEPVRAIQDLAVQQLRATVASGRQLSMVRGRQQICMTPSINVVASYAGAAGGRVCAQPLPAGPSAARPAGRGWRAPARHRPQLTSRCRSARWAPGQLHSLTLRVAFTYVLAAGAVVYGSSPHLIHARRSRYTYGIRCSGPHVPGAPDKEWEDEYECFLTHSFLQAFVSKGQQVRARRAGCMNIKLRSECLQVGYNEVVQHTSFRPLHRIQRNVSFPLYASDRTDVRSVRGWSNACRITLP